MPPTTTTRSHLTVLLLLLPLLLLALAADTVARLDPTPTPRENRRLATFPPAPADLAEATTWPWRVDSWVTDHFGCRASLLVANSWLRLRVLGVSPTPQAPVLVGRDGWLYYTGDRELEYTLRTEPFSAAELESWCRSAEGERQWLETRGARFLLVLAPNKGTVYPEHLPRWVDPEGRPSRADQLVEALSASTRVEVLDLRPVLENARQGGRVYHKNDSHWNQLGAHAAYHAIMSRLQEAFPAVDPRPLSRFNLRTVHGPGGDLAEALGAASFLTEEYPLLDPETPAHARPASASRYLGLTPANTRMRPSITERPDRGEIGRVVFLRDSFADSLQPLLSEHFGRAVYLSSDLGFPTEILEQEHPDVVILELVERYLSVYHPATPPVEACPAAPAPDAVAGVRRKGLTP